MKHRKPLTVQILWQLRNGTNLLRGLRSLRVGTEAHSLRMPSVELFCKLPDTGAPQVGLLRSLDNNTTHFRRQSYSGCGETCKIGRATEFNIFQGSHFFGLAEATETQLQSLTVSDESRNEWECLILAEARCSGRQECPMDTLQLLARGISKQTLNKT